MTPLEAVDKRMELNTEKKKYTQLYAAVNAKITARRAALKAAGLPKAQDVELLQLQNKAALLNAKLGQIKLKLAELPAMPEPEPPKKKTRILPLPNEETISIWQGLNLFQLKIVSLMIAEIGMVRFRELRKLASDDLKGKLAKTDFQPYEATDEPRIEKKDRTYDVNFEKMMRNNYNSYAGENL